MDLGYRGLRAATARTLRELAPSRSRREDGTVIEGLYSAGNNSASVMGRTYPGPGSTIGPAVVFGLRAARHMARQGG